MADDYHALMTEAVQAAGIHPRAIVQPADHTLTVQGVRLHYLDWGNESLPPLVLLHGGGLTAHTWDMAALLLRDRYHILALDQRGHGDSDWAADGRYPWEAHVQDIAGFVDALALPPFALVGMSLGGMNAIRYTARHPDRVRALVIVDIGPEIVPDGRAAVVRFRQETQEEADSPDWFLERAIRFNPSRPVAHLRYSLYHALKQLPNGRWTWKQDRLRMPENEGDDAQRAAAQRALAESLWQDWRTLRCPTFVIRGEHSPVITAEQGRQAAAVLPTGSFREIAGAGHNVHGDRPAAFAEAVDQFLARALAPA